MQAKKAKEVPKFNMWFLLTLGLNPKVPKALNLELA